VGQARGVNTGEVGGSRPPRFWAGGRGVAGGHEILVYHILYRKYV